MAGSSSRTTTGTATLTATPFLEASPGSGTKQVGQAVTVTSETTVEVITRGIAVTSAASASQVAAGSSITFDYEVTTGTGTSPMRVLTVNDSFCAPVAYVSGDTDADGLVDPAETWQYSCVSTYPGATQRNTSVEVVAIEPRLGGSSSNFDDVPIGVYSAGLDLTKTPSSAVVAQNSPVTYAYFATNTGVTDLTGLGVTDESCAPVVYVSGDLGDVVL